MADGYDSDVYTWIISAPSNKPTNLSMTRGNGTMELKWAIPLYLRSDDYSGRTISFIDARWEFNASKNMSTRYKEVREGFGGEIADRLWIRDLGVSATSHTQAYDRSRYHPLTPGRYLTSVTGSVLISDPYGTFAFDVGTYSSVTYKFGKPSIPDLGDLTFDAERRTVTGSYTCPDDTYFESAYYEEERYDVWLYVERRDNINVLYKDRTRIDEQTYTDDSHSYTTAAIEGANSLEYDQWIDIHYWVCARGFAGNSGWAHKLFTIAHPPKATVKGATVDTSKGFVTVRLSTNANAYHPVDTIELYRLANTTIWTAAAAKQASGWELAASSSDPGCTGLTDQLSEAQPSRDHYTFYRIKTTRCGYEQWSEPFRAKELEKLGSPVDDDIVQVYSVTPQEDGTSLKVVLGWNYYGQDGHRDDSNGTEVSWSQYEDAWQSTTAPNTYDLDDSRRDSSSQVPGKTSSATLVIRELEEGVPYYIKARRYQDNGDSRIYALTYGTAPDAVYPISPKTETVGVHLAGPQFVKRGDGCVLTWSFDSEKDQKSWNLYRQWEAGSGNETTVERMLVDSGDDQIGSAVLSAEKLGDGDSASFVVAVTTGGEWSESDPVTLTISDPPELELDSIPTLQEQPFDFSCACNMSSTDLIAKVTSNGASSGTPDGEIVQTTGDVIWSARFAPMWEMGQDGLFHASMVLPEGLPFIDGTNYRVELMAVDTVTGFTSNVCAERFSVNWSHKAKPPAPSSTITPNAAARTATVHPIAPSGAAQTDVYDLYRVSNDSCDLIAEGQPFGVDTVDRYAAYSRNLQLTYRIATRTKDGSVEWADFVYSMPVGVMRFDWGDDKYVEFPYNIALQDSYEKNYESHQHLDGSVSGHWNPGYKKTGTYSTDIIKVNDAAKAATIREMATYPGPVFVRTADGGAFEANVTLGIDTSYSSGAVGISLNVQAHTLSDRFKPRLDDFVEAE